MTQDTEKRSFLKEQTIKELARKGYNQNTIKTYKAMLEKFFNQRL